jgi:hypothetical protein
MTLVTAMIGMFVLVMVLVYLDSLLLKKKVKVIGSKNDKTKE